MSSGAQATPRKAPPADWISKRCAALLILPGLGTAFLWQLQNYLGARAICLEIDRLEAQGESLTWKPKILPGPVPDAENFGAAPCLRGLLNDEDKYGRGSEPPWTDIPGLEGLTIHRMNGRRRPPPRGVQSEGPPYPNAPVWVWQLPHLRFNTPADWGQCRAAMLDSDYFAMITDDVPDQWAVCQGLDKLEPIFSQLASAAGRPFAVFVPSPRERFHGDPPELDDADRSGGKLDMLHSIIALRGQAAAASGDAEEAGRMLRILLRLDDAAENESGDYHFRKTGGEFFISGLQDHLWSAGLLDEFTSALQVDDPGWVLHSLRLRLLYDGLDRITIGKNFFNRFVDQSPPWFIPQGWVDYGRAQKIMIYRTEMLEPFKSKGLSGLTGSGESFQQKCQSPPMMLARGWLAELDGPANDLLYYAIFRRITLMAAGVERHRLRHGRYPKSLDETSLPDRPERWLDLDGQPLRYAVSDDGKRAAIWSIAINLEDDWQGNPPDNAREIKSTASSRRPAARSKPPRLDKLLMDYTDKDWLLVLDAP